MLSPNKINIKIRWDLKSRLLAYVLYERLPEDGEELQKMCDFVFGEDCTFEKLKKKAGKS
ncbi:MAG TPA: hypothetical protein VMV77_03840 [Bacteroidales bacterium]|nr:hypothetical protein [Bacteroidales bacterium]